MKREVIMLDGNCKVSVPSDTTNVWMSEMELVELFDVIAPTLRAAIRAVYKSEVCSLMRWKGASSRPMVIIWKRMPCQW